MAKKEDKYERILNILRKSKPELRGTDDIEEKVLNKIQLPRKSGREEFNFFDYLFGWVYITWVRKTLITVSLFFVGLFIYQHSLILKRISFLENQTVITGSQVVNRTSFSMEDKMMLNDLSYRRLYNRQATITRRDLEKYLDSYNELENKYKDLIRLIEDDPGLKKMLEEKLTEKNSKKFNL
jgi:hypothetical protein